MTILEGNIIDVLNGDVFPGTIEFDERIRNIKENNKSYDRYICPGYIDPHIHIESTMMVPSIFSGVVAPHGTSAVVADPHEIANVMGTRGIEYMLQDSEEALIDVYFSAPSCVPATPYETSGAVLDSGAIDELLKLERVVALGEMMNYPGVINGDEECLKKILAAKRHNKPVDGHCPGLSGKELERYVAAGITTEHECTAIEEAREKAKAGMKIFIREGSSAKNLKALIALEDAFALCTDDKHADDLLRTGHMDNLLSMAVNEGKDPIDALRMVTLNPAKHYSLDGGVLEVSRAANILVLDGLKDFFPGSVYHHGREICKNGSLLARPRPLRRDMRVMNAKKVGTDQLRVVEGYGGHIIEAVDGELITMHARQDASEGRGAQKLVVADRHVGKYVSCAYVRGFGLDGCAIAQTIAHDSHNIIATGSDDGLIVDAINGLVGLGGGIFACSPTETIGIALDVSGLMSTMDPRELGQKLGDLERFLSEHGARMQNTVTTLSFMALLVIPHIKLSDRGLFDVDSFSFIDKC